MSNEEQMREEFIKTGMWPNEVMYRLWCKAWQVSAAHSAATIARLEEAQVAWGNLCAKANERNDELHKQLAAAQADNVRLREILTDFARGQLQVPHFEAYVSATAKTALAPPLYTSALEAYVAKEKAELEGQVAMLHANINNAIQFYDKNKNALPDITAHLRHLLSAASQAAEQYKRRLQADGIDKAADAWREGWGIPELRSMASELRNPAAQAEGKGEK